MIKRLALPADSDWLFKRPIAHRGLHDGAAVPENSLPAFQRAVDAGFAIELDVRLSADGDAYVFHDPSLLRMTGLDRAFEKADRECLRPLRLFGGDQPIPRLEETLELIAGRVPLLVEVKNEGDVGLLECRVGELLRGYRGQVAVQSFNPFTVRWFRRHLPGVPRGQLASNFRGIPMPRWKKMVLSRMWLNPVSKPHFIAYDVRCLPHRGVNRARRRGLPVLTWTVDSDEKLRTARAWADNVIFEKIHPGRPPASNSRGPRP